MKHFLDNVKGYAVLVAAVATALLGVVAADSEVGKALTIVAVIATAVAGVALPAPSREKPVDGA